MSIDQVIILIMLAFMVIGVIDKAFLKNRLGFGEEFENGVMAMGTLAIAMVGIMCLAPVLGNVLSPIVGPVYKALGADPAMFAGTILAIDMGGTPLAQVMTSNAEVASFSGIILGSMMGATIVFSIPVSLGIINKEDKPYLARGMMAGMIAIPFGCFISGLVSGMSIGLIIANLIPVFIIAALLALGLWFIPNGLLRGFNGFSIGITVIILLAFAIAIIQGLTGGMLDNVPIIRDMDPIDDQLVIVGYIAITLAGAYPLVRFITKYLSKPLGALGKLIGVNDVTIGGMIACVANNIPMFGMLKDMDVRGKILAVAFSVPASFALGDHLGFTAANAQDKIVAMILGKLLGGVIAIIIASFFIPKDLDTKKTKKAKAKA